MNKKDLKRIAQQIKEKRRVYGYTQEQMAEQLNLSYSYYTKIENGYQTPSLNTLVKITSALHISLDKLIYENSTQNSPCAPDITELLESLESYDRNELIRCRDLINMIINCLNDQKFQ